MVQDPVSRTDALIDYVDDLGEKFSIGRCYGMYKYQRVVQAHNDISGHPTTKFMNMGCVKIMREQSPYSGRTLDVQKLVANERQKNSKVFTRAMTRLVGSKSSTICGHVPAEQISY